MARYAQRLIREKLEVPPGTAIATLPADAILARVGRSGAMVVGVDPGGPADRAGIRPARALPGSSKRM